MNLTLANTIFKSWEKGEQTGNYEEFKKHLSTEFIQFSHPLLGKFQGKKALEQLLKLIEEREVVSNNLTFSNIKITYGDNHVVFQFDSKGMVQNNSFSYKGFNSISFEFKVNKLIGFQEYFGYVNPNWFK